MCSFCTGTQYLAEKLSTHLINEIMKNLPSISQYIDQKWVGTVLSKYDGHFVAAPFLC
jgi:hypothetical protein